MPFTPGGIFNLVSSYFAEAGSTIRTEQHNPPLEDIGSALSSVLIRDGRAPMIGPLNMNGNPINNLAPGSTPSSVATVSQGAPIGAVMGFALKTAPPGWIFGYGQVLLANTAYPLLRTALINDGFTYGQDGSGNPKCPDYRDVPLIGRGDMGGATRGLLSDYPSLTLGQLIGFQSIALVAAQLAKHKHSGDTDPSSHMHGTLFPVFTTTTTGGGAFAVSVYAGANTTANSNLTQISQSFTTNDGNGVSGEAHPNVQPGIISNIIIRASYDG